MQMADSCPQQRTARATHFAAFLVAILTCTANLHAAVPAWLLPITQTAEPFIGVTHYQITQSFNSPAPYVLPREVSLHIVEINPNAPGISFLGTPGNGATAEEYTRQTTSSFVNNHDLAVGVNGDFYSTDTGANASVIGLGMSNGAIVSPAVSGWHSFVTRQNNTAIITSNGGTPSGAWNAVSGNQRLVTNGVNVAPNDSYTTTLNPHTAVGIDASNGHIFFMVVDGRQGNFSRGMRTDEMADILIDFGVDNAINLDGGGSSTLVFGDGAGGAARTVNSPSDGSSEQSPGGQRSVANHFGVFATPNPAYTRLPAPPRPGSATPDPFITSLTVFDAFDGGEGRFSSTPTFSGSNRGIAAETTAAYTETEAQAGVGSQQITIVRDDTAVGRLRHLSGVGAPGANRVNIGGQTRAMSRNGFVGFFLKATEADLQVGVGIDDGYSAGTTGTEISNSIDVIADGKWHLYEWNLADANLWTNFNAGNGAIDGPNAFIDSIFFHTGSSTANEAFTVYLDTVAYNPNGSLASLIVPEVFHPADFNEDGAVDAVDLSAWQSDFGPTNGSDADRDGDSDGADFLAWQRRLGAPQPTATAVPEPAGLVLAAAAIVAKLSVRLLSKRRRLSFARRAAPA